MTDQRVRTAMRNTPVPDEEAAEERAWRVVERAFERDAGLERGGGARRRREVRPALMLGVLAVLGAVAYSPPGEAVGKWISDTVRPAQAPAQPALTSLPSDGRVLVTYGRSAWVVQPDGAKRRIGRYTEAGWSPRGLFVVATRGRQLVALEPDGTVRWALARSAPVTSPAWSPDGFRIAYLSGEDLRVVAGDGTGDALLAGEVAQVTPAWRPGQTGHALAYVNRLGTVQVRNGDTGARQWRARVAGFPTRLSWSPDGAYLVVTHRDGVDVFRRDGTPTIDRRAAPFDARIGATAVDPGGRTVAAVRYRPSLNRSEVITFALDPGDRSGAPPARRVFAGDGRFTDLAWSPDGRWLLLAWRSADQWLFIRSTRVDEVQSVSNVGRQFDPGGGTVRAFPRVRGWCCAGTAGSTPG